MPEITCKVSNITALTPAVSCVTLTPSVPMEFKAGQYLQVIMGEKDKRPFSIANSPDNNSTLELHIGAGPDNSYASEVLERMKKDGEVTVDGGHGKAFWQQDKSQPIILMAGGTGFSYTWSILQTLLNKQYKGPVFLYWGTRTLEDMYAFQQLNELASAHKQFKFMPVIEQASASWTGHTGWVHKAVMTDFVSLEPYQVYVAGRFEMAGVAREDFHQKGLLNENLFGDAFEFI